MKLAILGGGGVRMPAFVHALLSSKECLFDDIALFEPDALRRATTARLAAGVAAALGHGDSVRVTAEVEEAFNGADFVFSAIRVGGDGGRIIDEEVALSRGIVGQETTGPGGAAMALRTIPVVLDYCRILARVAPRAVLVNFTNPAGIVTEAITRHSGVRAVGVCDTPSGTIEQLAAFLHLDEAPWSYSYGGLNHLGWITSLCVDGEERLGELLEHYELLQRFDHRFAAHDADLVRRVGALPTEYVFYYYDPRRYLEGVRHAGSTRGKDVARLNEELLVGLSRAFASGESAVDSFNEAWALYCKVMGVRRDTYLRIDTDGESGQQAARARREGEQAGGGPDDAIGGYEGIALEVIAGLTGRRAGEVIVNTRNGASLSFLEPDDVVELPSLVHSGGIAPLAGTTLPASARGLITQVKEYERAVVEAAVTGDAELAALALALHPLVPGITAARELTSDYRERHGADLAYLS